MLELVKGLVLALGVQEKCSMGLKRNALAKHDALV